MTPPRTQPPEASPVPSQKTSRLVLRPFSFEDAAVVRRLAGDPEIAATTLTIPHPYPDGAAEKWIATHASQFLSGRGLVWAVCLHDGSLVGTVGLSIQPAHRRGELGYWIGRPWWNRGFATEAAGEILAWGFRSGNLHKVTSRHMEANPASGRVMEKIGLVHEGTLKDEFWKNDRPVTVHVYGVTRDVYAAS